MKILFVVCLFALADKVSSTETHKRRLSLPQALPRSIAAGSGPSPADLDLLTKKVQSVQTKQGINWDEFLGETLPPPPFDAERDDLFWPGSYPSTALGSKEDLMINIRWDNGPGTNNITTRYIFSKAPAASVSKTIQADKSDGAKQASTSSPLRQYSIDYFDLAPALYMVEITDEMGDGICCGENGNGW